MKKIILFILIVIATILFTSCSTQQRVVYRDCNCNTTGFGLGWGNTPYWGWNDPFWGWNRWGWNDPFWGWRNQIVIIPQRFRQITPTPPIRYNQRGVTQPSRGRVVTPQPQRRTIQPNNGNGDNVYPYRNTTTPPYRTSERSAPQRRVTTPTQTQRGYTPQRTTPVQRTPPQRTTSPPSRVGRGGN